MPKPWNEVRLPIAAYLAEIRSSALTLEQQGRLALAWPSLWLAGKAAGAPEDDWRRALGYSLEEWDAVRERYADCLDLSPGGWALVFMRAEHERQAAVSAKQSTNRNGGQPRSTTVDDGCPPLTDVDPASASASEPVQQRELLDLTTVDHGQPPSKASVTRDWKRAFEEHFWPTYRPMRPDGKAAALAVWMRIDPKDEARLNLIMDGLEAQIVKWKGENTEQKFIPHARTWLFQQRWLDFERATA